MYLQGLDYAKDSLIPPSRIFSDLIIMDDKREPSLKPLPTKSVCQQDRGWNMEEELEILWTEMYDIVSLKTECKEIKSLPICVIYPRHDGMN